jgi:peptidoglycan/LPS O-acetylase OafA/YrhL
MECKKAVDIFMILSGFLMVMLYGAKDKPMSIKTF